LCAYAFDLLFHNGEDSRKKPRLYRKEIPESLTDMLERPILYSEHHVGDGQVLFEAAAKLNYEEISSEPTRLVSIKADGLGKRSKPSIRGNSPSSGS
jgi:hypothetical protein